MGRWIAVLLWGLGASAWAQAPGRFTKLGDEIVTDVRERFYDAKRAEAWAERHKGYGAAAKDEEDFERLTHAALAELQTSHTAYYPRDTLGHVGLTSVFRWALKLKQGGVREHGRGRGGAPRGQLRAPCVSRRPGGEGGAAAG